MKKKRVVAAAILIIVLLCLYRGADHLARPKETTTRKHNSSSSSSISGQDTGSTHLPTKVSNRPANTNPHATHRPEKLKHFFLPEVAIDGLPLKDALAKLRTAYEDVCRDSGEVPLRLTFIVPPDATRPLNLKAGIRNLDASIRLLAAMAGLKVTRTGSEYAFVAPQETGETEKKSFQVSPDFFSRPSTAEVDPFAEGALPTRMSPAEYFASKGITLDPSTKISLTGTTLKVESTRAADQIAIEGLIDVTMNDVPLQHKLDTRIIRISAGIDWTPPDLSQLDDAGAALMTRQLAQTKGVDMVLTPATVAKPGQSAKVEIIRDVIFPPEVATGEFTTDQVGVIADVRPVPYGFGHRVDLNFSEKVIEEGPETAPFKIVARTSINDSSFTGDGNSRLHLQTHPDGTRLLVLVTPTLVDPTGRPLHPKE